MGRDGYGALRPGLGADIVEGAPGTNGDQSFDDRDQVDWSDVRAGEFDIITDWSLTDEFLYLPSVMQVETAADLQASTFFV